MKYEVKLENKVITITLDNGCGLVVILTNVGASIVSIKFNDELLTLTPEKITDFLNPNIYYGKTIGPFVNRMKDSSITIDNVDYPLDANEFPNSLHSGKFGLSNQRFKYDIINNKGFIGAVFMLTKKHKADNIPGKIVYTIGYVMQEGDNTLYVSMNARSDKNTILGMTNHTYFTLGEKKIDNLKLTIPSHKFIETGKEDLLPLNEKIIIPCLDFQKGKRLDKDINDSYLQEHKSKGYDHCFLLDKGEIKLENSKYLLEITTDFDAVQIYSDNYEDNIKMLNTEEIIHRGVAIEPQDNILTRRYLKKGEFYTHKINYKFSKK